MDYSYTIWRPGGNDTALVKGMVTDLAQRKIINDEIMKQYPNVEQVGFVDLNSSPLELVMAGGDFCGNATRSTAYWALNGQPGEVLIKVSGASYPLRAGVDRDGNAWAQMPIRQDLASVQTIDQTTSIVTLDGITQIVKYEPLPVGLSEEASKQYAKTILRQYGLLDSVSATGVMFVTEKNGVLSITPIVWVRDIATLFLETACGSGTTAIGLEMAKRLNRDIKIDVVQPTGIPITIQVRLTKDGFASAQISGPITRL
jgi:diaminopimelate epimerase